MDPIKFKKNYEKFLVCFAAVALPLSLAFSGENLSSIHFPLFLLVAIVMSPFMSITLPGGKATLEFSDAIIFLSFLLFGGSAAIVVAGISMLSVCIYIIKIAKNPISIFRISTNVGASMLGTALTVGSIQFIDLYLFPVINLDTGSNLIALLGLLAIFQFIWVSVVYCPVSNNFGKLSIKKIWMDECFPLSLTHIAGAGVAFVAYRLTFESSILATAVGASVIALMYFNYRRSVSDVETSRKRADEAERVRQEVERQRSEEAEKHAALLAVMLDNEEVTSEALRSSKERFEYSAYHDPLTDLSNRLYVMERLKFLIELGMEKSNEYYVLYFDISKFKNINDSLGHSVGDKVLKMTAMRLRRTMRDEDTISRLGGDEFALILTNLASPEKAMKVARKVYEVLTRKYMIGGTEVYTDIFMGLSPLQYEHARPEDALRDATIAMRQAKMNGKPIALFDKSSRVIHLEKIRIESDLRTASERKQLSMNYQPLISLSDGSLMGFEALLRWKHPKFGNVSPGVFIPIAEESGSIVPITNWILTETCEQLAKWNKGKRFSESYMMSVNVSGKHLRDFTLLRDIQRALLTSNVDPRLLKIEITESAAMENPERSIKVLESLNMLGIQLSIDDFGTGYSSLSYLHKIPFDTLKIDRSFVKNAEEGSEKDMRILESIVALTKNLEKKIIAEGIETEKQLEIVQSLGCEVGQGYLFAKPRTPEDISNLLTDVKPWLEFNAESDKFEITRMPEAVLIA